MGITNVNSRWGYKWQNDGMKWEKINGHGLIWQISSYMRAKCKSEWGYKCKNGWRFSFVKWSEMKGAECEQEEWGRGVQSLFRRAERTALAAWLRSTWRPLSIILIIESSRGCFKTSNLSDVSRSRVTIPHSLHSAPEIPAYCPL